MDAIDQSISDDLIRDLSPHMSTVRIKMFSRVYLDLDESDMDKACNTWNNNLYEYVYCGLSEWKKKHPNRKPRHLLDLFKRFFSMNPANSNKPVQILEDVKDESTITPAILSNVAVHINQTIAKTLLEYLGTEADASALMPASATSPSEATSNLLNAWRNKQGKAATVNRLRELVTQAEQDFGFESGDAKQLLTEALVKQQKTTIKLLLKEIRTQKDECREKTQAMKKMEREATKKDKDVSRRLDVLQKRLDRESEKFDKEMLTQENEKKRLKDENREEKIKNWKMNEKFRMFEEEATQKIAKLEEMRQEERILTTEEVDAINKDLRHLSATAYSYKGNHPFATSLLRVTNDEHLQILNFSTSPRRWRKVMAMPRWFDGLRTATCSYNNGLVVIGSSTSFAQLPTLSTALALESAQASAVVKRKISRRLSVPNMPTTPTAAAAQSSSNSTDGENLMTSSTKISLMDLIANQEVGLPDIPCPSLHDAGLAHHSGWLYVVGGREGGGRMSRKVYSLDLTVRSRQRRWTELPALRIPVRSAVVLCNDQYLFVVGGYQSGSDAPCNRLQIYCFGTSSWCHGQRMSEPCDVINGGVVLNNNHLLVLTNTTCHTYDIDKAKWSSIRHGIKADVVHVLMCAGEVLVHVQHGELKRLYQYDSHHNTHTLCSNVDVYYSYSLRHLHGL